MSFCARRVLQPVAAGVYALPLLFALATNSAGANADTAASGCARKPPGAKRTSRFSRRGKDRRCANCSPFANLGAQACRRGRFQRRPAVRYRRAQRRPARRLIEARRFSVIQFDQIRLIPWREGARRPSRRAYRSITKDDYRQLLRPALGLGAPRRHASGAFELAQPTKTPRSAVGSSAPRHNTSAGDSRNAAA